MTEQEKEMYMNPVKKYLIVHTKDGSIYLYNLLELEKVSIGLVEISISSFEKIKINKTIEL